MKSPPAPHSRLPPPAGEWLCSVMIQPRPRSPLRRREGDSSQTGACGGGENINGLYSPPLFLQVATKDGVFVLDMAAKIDATADYICKAKWGDVDFPPPFGREAYPEVRSQSRIRFNQQHQISERKSHFYQTLQLFFFLSRIMILGLK